MANAILRDFAKLTPCMSIGWRSLPSINSSRTILIGPPIVLDVYRQVKEFIEDEGDKPTGASPWAPTAQPPQPQQPNPQQLIAQMDALVNARKVAAQQAAGRWRAWGLRWR